MIWRENDSWESHYDRVKGLNVRITSQKVGSVLELEAEVFVPKREEWKYQYMSDILYREVEEEIVAAKIELMAERGAINGGTLEKMASDLTERSCSLLFSTYFKEHNGPIRTKYREEFATELNSKLISTLE